MTTPLKRPSNQHLTLGLAIILACFLGACSPEIGDACISNQDCGAGTICDTTAPDGYCTATPCETNSCPEEAACVEFPTEQSFCMYRCSSSSDCRDGYTCRNDLGPVNFCYVE